MARMARLTEVFTGRDTRYFDLFEESARTAVTAAELLQRFIDGIPDEAKLAKEIGKVESEADRITHDIIQHVGATFVTPIEREDILELASAQDDVVDLIDETADLILLYKVEAPMEEAKQMAPEAISDGASAGRVTSRITAQDPAPSERAASATDLSSDCAAAITASTILGMEKYR